MYHADGKREPSDSPVYPGTSRAHLRSDFVTWLDDALGALDGHKQPQAWRKRARRWKAEGERRRQKAVDRVLIVLPFEF